jgi:hypothetical protein
MAARDAHDRRADAEQRRQLRAIKKVRSAVFSGSSSPSGCLYYDYTLECFSCRLVCALAWVMMSRWLEQAKRRAAAMEEAMGVATLGAAGSDQSDGGAASDSSDDDQPQRPAKAANFAQAAPARPGAESAHAGMVPAQRQRQTVGPTLAEREALALSLLSGSWDVVDGWFICREPGPCLLLWWTSGRQAAVTLQLVVSLMAGFFAVFESEGEVLLRR